MDNDKLYNYLVPKNFVKYSNTDDFPTLSRELRELLKTTGIYATENAYPGIFSDGKLLKTSDTLVQFGTNVVGCPFCIDTAQSERIIFINKRRNNFISIVNSSFSKLLECQYTMMLYYAEIEHKRVYGEYYENENHVIYAQKLRDMLNEVEPGIEQYKIWEEGIVEKELGVI